MDTTVANKLADSHQTSFTASRDPGQFDEACSPQAVLVSALTIVLLLCLLLWQCWKTRTLEVEHDILERQLIFLHHATGGVLGKDEARFRKKLEEVLHQDKLSSYEVGYTWTYDRKVNKIQRGTIDQADEERVAVSPIRKRLPLSHLRGFTSLAETPSPTPEPDNRRFRVTPPSSPAYLIPFKFS